MANGRKAALAAKVSPTALAVGMPDNKVVTGNTPPPAKPKAAEILSNMEAAKLDVKRRATALGEVEGNGALAQPKLGIDIIAAGAHDGTVDPNDIPAVIEAFRLGSATASRAVYKALSEKSMRTQKSMFTAFHTLGTKDYGLAALGTALDVAAKSGRCIQNLQKIVTKTLAEDRALTDEEMKAAMTTKGRSKSTTETWIEHANTLMTWLDSVDEADLKRYAWLAPCQKAIASAKADIFKAMDLEEVEKKKR